MAQDEQYIQVDQPREVAQCLAALMQHRGASLLMESPGSVPLPVVLLSAEPDQPLQVDISSIREAARELREGTPFRLLGRSGGKLLRTSPLSAQACQEEEGCLQCLCAYPETFEVLHRRDAFRAELRHGLECDVLVSGGEEHGAWDGKLRNLSMSGCLVELPLGAAGMLAAVDGKLGLELHFPDATRFSIQGDLSHHHSNMEQRFVRAGIKFDSPTPSQDRSLWYFVREIERESARNAGNEPGLLSVSALFTPSQDAPALPPRSKGEDFPTPMARNLSIFAEFLNTQVMALRTGGNVDAAQLSRHAERLLVMLDQGREALLFALVCLPGELALVRHSLGMAVRLVDLAGPSVPHKMRKAMMASAMVHDLGKALLPTGLLQCPKLSPERYQEMTGHVQLLLPRLQDSSWLAKEIVTPVILQPNERLDGSGYPHSLKAEELHELARMAAVVDVVDAMGRTRADRPALAIDAIYRGLREQPERFDPRWVSRYQQHFGALPIGTLLRFGDGALGWVQALDQQGHPCQVQMTSVQSAPRAATLGRVLAGEELAALGEAREILPSEY